MAIPKARRFILTLDTTSQAFKYADGGPAGPEIARVLRQIADEVERMEDATLLQRRRPVTNVNGEGIGTYELLFQ